MNLFIAGIKWPPETFIRRRIQALVANRVSVTVFVGGGGMPLPELPTVNVRAIPRWSSGRLEQIMLAAALVLTKALPYPCQAIRFWRRTASPRRRWRERIRLFLDLLPFVAERPDVLHFEWNSAAIHFLPLFDLLECPVVVSCRGSQISVAPSNPDRVSLVNGLKETFERAAAVHCVSEAIKRDAQTYGLTPDKAQVIYTAVDPKFFAPRDQSQEAQGPLSVLMVGSLIWRKGYEYALVALRRALDEGCNLQLEVIGEGEDYQRLLFTVGDLGLAAHVTLSGKQDAVEVRERMQSADIFLLSSLSEGIANSVVEAMACGLPVVTTDCGGMREAIDDGVEGYLVPIRDPEAIAQALIQLAGDASLRKRMGQAGRERVLRQFTLERQAEQFGELYESLMAGRTSLSRGADVIQVTPN